MDRQEHSNWQPDGWTPGQEKEITWIKEQYFWQNELEEKTSRFLTSVKRILWAVLIGIALVGLILLILIGYRFAITLWDWLNLLIVPVVLAVGGYLFNNSQNKTTQAAANRRAQDEALQAYLDNMSDMLIPKDSDQLSLYKSHPGAASSSVARARTLTVLSSLDGDRRAHVVRFLHEVGLITKGNPILDLRGAVLREANLKGADLSRANLSQANLSGADLRWAFLFLADLSRVKILEGNLLEADLREANLSAAVLGLSNLSGANLSGADLRRARLNNSNLQDADLSGANLSQTNLSGANLSGADLSDAAGVTKKQLEQAKSLKGATLPNGQKYEDWLKEREGREDDGGNK